MMQCGEQDSRWSLMNFAESFFSVAKEFFATQRRARPKRIALSASLALTH